jgi:cellulose synthase/poly-beta-1,6-N-acetylglucosamine synthase-like glycosyltransferase
VRIDPFDLELEGAEGLQENERLMLLRLVATGQITEAQANEVLAIHRRHLSPVLSILLALRYLSQRDYATHLAELTQTGYASESVDDPELAYDEAFVRQFDPAELVRFLFCPLRQVGDLVVTLAVDPDDPEMRRIIGRVAPGAEVIALAATELDITRRVDRIFQAQLLYNAVNSLRAARPDLSASQVFSPGQLILLAVLLIALTASLLWSFWPTIRAVLLTINLFYLLSVAYKLMIGIAGSAPNVTPAPGTPPHLDDTEKAAIEAADLPIYSILVPVYKEPEVVPQLLAALARLDYPPEKLDVLILLEEHDTETIAQAKASKPPSFFRFIYVPKSLPQTKPKACNYGLHFCRGEYVTIYDAEDIPEPDQLKAAVRAFRDGSKDLVCVQAALNYFNHRENYLTRMFTLEYSFWFDYMLPGLDRLGLPIPLGGTSNHFLLSRLRHLGGWDPFNVTEDADLGIRASCEGFTVGVIRSTTYEEANRAGKNWIRQRSRWIKGYMQTWLVHNRNPISLIRQIGLRRWLSYQFFIGGTCLTFLANPILWLFYVVWLIARPSWTDQIFGSWLVLIASFNFFFGNLIGIYQGLVAVFRRRLFHLVPYALTNPFYWWMHSIAAYMGLWQLFTKPFYWEKTVHGLTSVKAHQVMHPGGIVGT